MFGDITTGRIWDAEIAEVLTADDGNPAKLARIHERDAGLRRLVEGTYRARGGLGETLPGAGVASAADVWTCASGWATTVSSTS